MSSLTQIVDGVAARLGTITALDGNILTVVRRPAVFPAVIIVPANIPYDLSLEAGSGGQFQIRLVLLAGTVDAEMQATLWPFLDWVGVSSIPAAFQADRHVGLTDVDVRVGSVEAPGLIELPDGTPTYGCTFTLEIVAS